MALAILSQTFNELKVSPEGVSRTDSHRNIGHLSKRLKVGSQRGQEQTVLGHSFCNHWILRRAELPQYPLAMGAISGQVPGLQQQWGHVMVSQMVGRINLDGSQVVCHRGLIFSTLAMLVAQDIENGDALWNNQRD